MGRGASIGGTSLPVTSITVNPQHSLITEQSMGSGGETKIYDGGVITTGTIEANIRSGSISTEIHNRIAAIMTVLNNPGSMLSSVELKMSDETDGISFASAVINSVELSMSAKDFGKVKFGFIAKGGSEISSFATADYSTEAAIANVSTITCSGISDGKFMAVTMKAEVPIDQDYFVIGTNGLAEFVQSGTGSITGSITLAPKTGGIGDYAECGAILGSVSVAFNTGQCTSSGTVGTASVTGAIAESVSMSGQSRQRFEKTINFRVPLSSETCFQYS